MTFNVKDFAPLSNVSQQGSIPRIWGYYHATDTFATMDTAGYFNDVASQLSVGDAILARDSTNGSAQWSNVLSNASGVVDISDFTLLGVNTDTD